MDLQPTPTQQALIRRAVESGRFKSEEEALRAALDLWEQCELERPELLAALAEGEADLAAGRFTDHDGSSSLARELKQEARTQRQHG